MMIFSSIFYKRAEKHFLIIGVSYCLLFLSSLSPVSAQVPELREKESTITDVRRSLLIGGVTTEESKSQDGSEPVFISADSLELKTRERVFTYRGNVEAFQGDLLITSDRLRGSYNEANELEDLNAEGGVVITRGNRLRATANRAEYDVPGRKILLTESPEVVENDNALAADRVTLFLDEDRSLAEGTVRVKLIQKEEQGAGGIGSLLKSEKEKSQKSSEEAEPSIPEVPE